MYGREEMDSELTNAASGYGDSQPTQPDATPGEKVYAASPGYSSGNSAPPPPRPPKKRWGRRVLGGLLALVLVFGCGYLGAKLALEKVTDDITAAIRADMSAFLADSGGAVLYRGVETEGSAVAETPVVNVQKVASLASDSVVEISTQVATTSIDPFSWFFGNGSQLVQGAGSGVIISDTGYILTCYHVIAGATSISVALHNGDVYQATVVGGSEEQDMAIIKIDATDLTAAVLGDSDELNVGSPVVAIGNPLGSLGGTVTSGFISALDRQLTIDNQIYNLLQTDAAINSGNSGGGLFNAKGELIGLVNAKAQSIGVEGLGFAIPINDIKTAVEDVINYGSVTKVTLGVTLMNIDTERKAQGYGLDELGVYILEVSANSNASHAGLRAGDRIISVDGEQIEDSDRVVELIRAKRPGDVMNMVISRSGEQIIFDITLYDALPDGQSLATQTSQH